MVGEVAERDLAWIVSDNQLAIDTLQTLSPEHTPALSSRYPWDTHRITRRVVSKGTVHDSLPVTPCTTALLNTQHLGITRAGAIAMEPYQISAAVLTIVNTSRIIQQYVQYLQNRARKRRQRNYYTDEDMDTDGTACDDREIMVVLGQDQIFQDSSPNLCGYIWPIKRPSHLITDNHEMDQTVHFLLLSDGWRASPSSCHGYRQHLLSASGTLQSLRSSKLATWSKPLTFVNFIPLAARSNAMFGRAALQSLFD
ncbi:hypothetical protein UY3_05989 [Chelonia mydas]|uniref:Uncharacterized protein n=1 Tax=Chelonia mydas TaxID=8469 RepID=M7BXQ7_CHEMY|nr:hypothetical protein UY3_05989 [Chelonia mydas]